MAAISLDVHDVVSIKLSPFRPLNSIGSVYREIIITDKQGRVVEITCFGDAVKDLKVHHK